ncbi:MAG: gluconate:H+ symporter [Acidobacteriota bacterium]
MLGSLACLLIGVGTIIFLLLVVRLHAFLSLLLASLLVAFLSDRIAAADAASTVAAGFADLMGKIGILLVLASIVGKCLVDSGAADRIIRSFTAMFGEGREQYSFLASGFVLSMPVFFDSVFYLLAPLVRAAYARRKRDYALMICAAAGGAVVTHALVPPTPGPVVVSETLHVSMGITFLMGMVLAIVPAAVGGIGYAYFINRRLKIEPQEVYGVSNAEMERLAHRPDSELPSLAAALSPVLLPVVLITLSTVTGLWLAEDSLVQSWIEILGNKDVAFLIGALAAVTLVGIQSKLSVREVAQGLEPAVAAGAGIAFITCAGGAFGRVLTLSGVGDLIASASSKWGFSLLTLAFVTAALIRLAQGSATVAMITTAGMIAPAVTAGHLAIHPVYLVGAIGFGATTTSWMNDSGFWIVAKMGGMTESETLKTWTTQLTIIAIVGYFWCWLLSSLFPLVS